MSQFLEIWPLLQPFQNATLPKLSTCNFVGQINSSISDMFLLDFKGFFYYNKVLEDLVIVFGSGATVLVTPSWVDYIDYTPKPNNLHNILIKSNVLGYGIFLWEILDDKGVSHFIRTKTYLVPSVCICFLAYRRSWV